MAPFVYLKKKYNNPYKCYFLFGKKGAGKSCYMVKLMLRYLRMGWNVYTDMQDVNIDGVRLIDSVEQLAVFSPDPNSVLFLDEVGITMDNRDFKSFPKGLRDFFKYVRKQKLIVYMNSQAFDVDKKVRDTTDEMGLLSSFLGCISLYRPITRVVTLVDATANGESKIADNLRFRSLFSWKITWMPRYYRYFNSLEMPRRASLPYDVVSSDIKVEKFNAKRYMHYVRSKVKNFFRSR